MRKTNGYGRKREPETPFKTGLFVSPRRFLSFCVECGKLLEQGELTIHGDCAIEADRMDKWIDDYMFAHSHRAKDWLQSL